ncbi:MAG: hypothetical protein ABSC93_05415 [Bryobacteraceae bacterium]|jgi:hypothetical protein
MRRALVYILLGTALAASCAAAERRSWNKIHYIGGTIPIKTSPYDWDTRLTIAPNDSIVLVIAPQKLFAPEQTVRIQGSQILSLSAGPLAWRRVAEVNGAQLPAKPRSLFGLWQDVSLLGIVYQAENGKRGAILLDSYYSWQIQPAFKKLTGKVIETSP